MKEIKAIIKPFKVDAVKEAITEIGVRGMTLVDVEGFGSPEVATPKSTVASEYAIDFVPKVMILIAVTENSEVNAVVDAIIKAAKTDAIGDGKIIITARWRKSSASRTGERARPPSKAYLPRSTPS